MKKKNLGLWLSITATIISIIALGIVCGRWVSFPSTAESFIAILVSLFALCVTFAIGYQIYNSLDLKESIGRMDDLEKKLEADWIELKSDMYNIETDLCYGRGIDHFEKGNYPMAIYHYFKGLYCSLFCDNADMTNAILKNIDATLEEWVIDESYGISKSIYTIRNKKPINLIIERLDKIVDECSDCSLYSAYVDRIRDYKILCEQKIEEHEEWVKNNPAKNK